MHTASVKHLWWPWMWGGCSMSWRGTWIDECLGMSFVVGYKPIGATWKNLHRASQCKWQQTPIQAHSLPCACWAGSCLLCCQHELSLNRHRPDYQELCHDRLSEWKLKGDESLRWAIHKIRPHRRCWGVIVRMALVKGYRFTWGGAFFGQNLLFLIGRDARLQKTL